MQKQPAENCCHAWLAARWKSRRHRQRTPSGTGAAPPRWEEQLQQERTGEACLTTWRMGLREGKTRSRKGVGGARATQCVGGRTTQAARGGRQLQVGGARGAGEILAAPNTRNGLSHNARQQGARSPAGRLRLLPCAFVDQDTARLPSIAPQSSIISGLQQWRGVVKSAANLNRWGWGRVII